MTSSFRTVVITGASAGVGRATAIEFARHGWAVGLIARGEGGLAAAKADVERHGGTGLVLRADAADAAAIDAAAEQVQRIWGGIDIWINAAMVTILAPVEKIAPEEFRRVTEVTYLGQVHGTIAALRHMRRQGHGTIVSVGSALAYRGIPLQAPYCGAKFAVRGFLDSLRSELLHDESPIRLTAVHLPAVNTPQFDWARNKMAHRPQPVPPIFQPEAIARAIFRAAHEAPRELWVGRSTLQVITGHAAAPSVVDNTLASQGYSGQQTSEPANEGRPDNLFEPVDHDRDFGAHGRFDRQASHRAMAIDPGLLRSGLMVAAGAVALGGLAYALAGGKADRHRKHLHHLGHRGPLPPRHGTSQPVEDSLPMPIAYPPIEKHGVVGDRRTAALVAADGTLDWLCLPNYDSAPVFGSLIDAEKGGFWRFGPAFSGFGQQRYVSDTATLVTHWNTPEGDVELSDAMLWPQTERENGHADRRVVLRRLRCRRGSVPCSFEVHPRDDFGRHALVEATESECRFDLGSRSLSLWTSFPVAAGDGGAWATFRLHKGEEAWAVTEFDQSAAEWTAKNARAALEETEGYWHSWTDRLSYIGPRREHVRRSAVTFHLLGFAPTGALVAAPTTSLPERIGGSRNYDYRFAWIRDVSLSMAILAMLGDLKTAERYMDWLSGLDSSNEMPLQVLYRIDGGTDAAQHQRDDLAGYRDSKPVLVGNHAFQQKQIDSFGYLSDCSLIYFQQGGTWKPEYWGMVRRLADYTAETWREPGHDIWELGQRQHYVSSKVMAWVTLERVVRIAKKAGEEGDLDRWRRVMDEIHADVMEKGWSESLQAFRQHYDADALDASALLIPMMGFLPADHPRVRATVERIEQTLTVDGLVYRFDPEALPEPAGKPLGKAEGAFLPCTFWLAATLAMMGEDDRAEAILARVETTAGELGLFAEEIDPRDGSFLGNTPLLFSHAEYLKAVMELAKSRPLGRAGMMASQALVHARNWMPGS